MPPDNFDICAIESLQKAAVLIRNAADVLRSNRENYQATNLPVEVAVSHVLSCLEKDASYLSQLADICSESAPILRKVENE